MHAIQAYLKFLMRSTNAHGVHSPFVFDLLTKCFYNHAYYPEYNTLASYRKSLFKMEDEIKISDFGAGSKVFASDKRTINAIAKNAGTSARRAKLLFRVANYFNPKNVLELGTSLGMGTTALALGSKNATVTTLEGCAETAAVAKRGFQSFELNNIEPVVSKFETFLSQPQLPKYDLIFFDGNHRKDATLQYVDALLPTVTNASVWIFDDIHWSAEMEQAWQTIKENPKVTATIDTFQWGFVFFRTEQEKEHFIVRA